MISVDNINILKSRFPVLYEDIKEYEAQMNGKTLEIRKARNGEDTLVYMSPDKELYMHSAYDPAQEANIILEQFPNGEAYEYVIFYGTGLGYHIEAFMRRYPKNKYYIYEPSMELLYQFLSYNAVKDNIKEITYGIEVAAIEEFIANIFQQSSKNTLIVDLPSHKNVYPEMNKLFLNTFKKMIRNQRISIKTDYNFQKQWILSAMTNFPEVLKTPNILSALGKFQGKTAILAAAGPSLNEEMENLRYIKENNLAYIFSVGSAVNTFIEYGLSPHATCTYDPQQAANKLVFKKIMERNIADIPLIYGST